MERVLGVAIGVAVVCLLLSIIASHVQEVWATFSARRAATLQSSIQSMLGDEIAKKFFDHPLLATISFSPPPSRWRPNAPSHARPTYIASALFSRILFATLVDHHDIQGSVTLPQLIQNLPPSDLQKRLQAIVVGTSNDAHACALAIEQWYDGTMDRINGLYKQNTQWVLLALGFVLAIVCNANLFNITEKLWTSDDARAALNASAQIYACKDGGKCPYPTYDVAQQQMSSNLETYLPVGYHGKGLRTYWGGILAGVRARWHELLTSDSRWHAWPVPLGDWLYHLAGWGLTGVAVSLGAPFWFDAVNKLINIRIAGDKPPRALPPAIGATPEPSAEVNVMAVAAAQPVPGAGPGPAVAAPGDAPPDPGPGI